MRGGLEAKRERGARPSGAPARIALAAALALVPGAAAGAAEPAPRAAVPAVPWAAPASPAVQLLALRAD